MDNSPPAPSAAPGAEGGKALNAPAPKSSEQSPTTTSQPNGQPKRPKNDSKSKQPATTPSSAKIPEGESKLSNAELKKRQKAEKQARRAAEKAVAQGPQQAQQPSLSRTGSQNKDLVQSPKTVDMGRHHRRTPSEAQGKQLPIRQGGGQPGGKDTFGDVRPRKKLQQDKKVSIFGHLYGQPRRTSLAGAGKEVHPAVLALGLQMRDYVVCGSNARCVAMLLCFKRVCLTEDISYEQEILTV